MMNLLMPWCHAYPATAQRIPMTIHLVSGMAWEKFDIIKRYCLLTNMRRPFINFFMN